MSGWHLIGVVWTVVAAGFVLAVAVAAAAGRGHR